MSGFNMSRYHFPRYAFSPVLGLLVAAVALPTDATSAQLEIAQAGSDERQWGSVERAPDNLPVKPTVPEPSQTMPGQTTPGGDVLLGAHYVGSVTDRDVIRVGDEMGQFAKIRLRVIGNDIHINELKVFYANGVSNAIAVDADIPKNSRTDWIDLRGDQFIKEIQMVYRARPSLNGQARIEVFGQYAPSWLALNGDAHKYNQGWVLLGAKTAGFVGFDEGIIPVGGNEGGFARIRISDRDRAITLNEVKVIYVGGLEKTIPIHARVDAGGTYGPIELKGETPIDHIEAKYRSRFFDSSAIGKGAAIVEFWGQHY
jgi:hypothetical protein